MTPDGVPGPSISVGHVQIRGAASGTQADGLARALTVAVESSAADMGEGADTGMPTEIPRLEVRVPAGARERELAVALARALARAMRRGRP
jgi:hypothetical protein